MAPSPKMASTLRLFTRRGREGTFSTSLVEDSYSRPLRALVADGFLTMDYTGTQRVYTLTPAGRAYLEDKPMGKKRQAAKTPAHSLEKTITNGHAERPKAPRVAARKSPSVTKAIRLALAELGPEAATPQVKQWITAHHPGVDVETPSFGSGLSAQRKKLRGQETPAKQPPAPRTPAPRTPPPARADRTKTPLTPLDVIRLMREVRDYAEAHEGVDGLLGLIQRVEELARRFGGLDCVRESLEAIKEFRQE